ncbi:hypothetical protein MMC10_007593 [Thelotrema lepadinum]|nr:hypothetical protein [Thelotrema lepadinum]
MFSVFSSNRRKDYTKVGTNRDGQQECEGCRDIRILLRRRKNLEMSRPSWEVGPFQCRVHWTYRELDKCATRCVGCQYLRRAFLLNEVTTESGMALRDTERDNEVWAKLPPLGGKAQNGTILEVGIRDLLSTKLRKSAQISCLELDSSPSYSFPVDPLHHRLIEQIKRWLRQCHDTHNQCARLGWSRKNPTNLLHILKNTSHVTLVAGDSIDFVEYAALSYIWGKEEARSESELNCIDANQTTKENKTERWSPFPRADLSRTVQDVIRLCERLGIEYVWIDAICISSDENWNEEGSKMHEIYGNAHLTLSICSTRRATDSLFASSREVWRYSLIPCKFDELYLRNHAMPLEAVRLQAPIFTRAWTLQEERLSPRILYWTAHSVYWSCLSAQHHEIDLPSSHHKGQIPSIQDPVRFRTIQAGSPTAASQQRSTAPSASTHTNLMTPQSFLSICRTGQSGLLHSEWANIVEDYTQRSMFRSTDRFPTLSGLAIQYMTGNSTYTSPSTGDLESERYLAGLWAATFGRDLAWTVTQVVDPEQSLGHLAPSWSWASLPLRTRIRTYRGPEKMEREAFELLDKVLVDEHEQYRDLEQSLSKHSNEETSAEVIRIGALVRSVKVRGRMRRFVTDKSFPIPWHGVQWPVTGQVRDEKPGKKDERDSKEQDYEAKEEKYDLRPFIDQDIYARDAASGKILAYQARSEEVVGQLDYAVPDTVSGETERTSDIEGANRESSREPTVALKEGDEKHLWCLEVANKAMLLLQEVTAKGIGTAVLYGSDASEVESTTRAFRRVGIAKAYAPKFFAAAELAEAWLV